MSNNGIPPLNDWQEDNYPVVYDEGATQLQYVKTGNKVDVPSGGSSYLVYTALLTQAGTDAPVATVLENTLGGTVVWTRDAVGNYTGTLAGVFTDGKTICNPFGSSLIPYSNVVVAYLQTISQTVNTVSTQLYDDLIYSNLIELSTLQGYILVDVKVYP